MISKADSLMLLRLNTVGIKIKSFPEGVSIVEGLEELAEKHRAGNPVYSEILSKAKDNLSILTWEGVTSRCSVIRGASRGGGFVGNYRLATDKDEAHLVKLQPWHHVVYAPKSPQFF